MRERRIEAYYPGWTKKAITFSIDDGNLTYDQILLDLVNPAGLHGTFNLTTPLRETVTAQEYRALYAGHDIANHCRYHAYPFADGKEYDICPELFCEKTADPAKVYLSGETGIYRIHTYAWTYLADDTAYMACVDNCQRELEGVFGPDKIRGYVWPCGQQPNAAVFEMLKQYGFQSIRKTGCVRDTTGFAIPGDRFRWSYNANHDDLLAVARRYEEYPDDGELKFFCFGVHAKDYEIFHRWDALTAFCEQYGNRPDAFWYAPVASVFDYQDTVAPLLAGESSVNASNMDLYLQADGTRTIVKPGESI